MVPFQVMKFAAGAIALGLLASGANAAPIAPANPDRGVELAQYYPGGDWRYQQQANPAAACADAGGRIYRIPQNRFNVIGVRPARDGGYRVQLSHHSRIFSCAVDRWGRVVDFR